MSQALNETPSPPVGVIETDAFCEGCGFNLHTQKVWRDERLEIAICRCPECGRHSPAGVRTTSTSVWARRAALAGLVTWMVLQVAFVLFFFGGICLLQAIASESLTSSDYMTRDGRIVIERTTGNSTVAGVPTMEFAIGEDGEFTVPPSDVVYGKRLAPWILGQPMGETDRYRFASPVDALVVGSIFAVLIFSASAVLAALSWYWRRGTIWLWLLLPMMATLVISTIINQDSSSRRSWANGVMYGGPETEIRLAIAVCAMVIPVMVLGLLFGRSIARLFVSIFIPPRARQLFAFLWHCDGKTMPRSRMDLKMAGVAA